jgi:hypothetical protein
MLVPRTFAFSSKALFLSIVADMRQLYLAIRLVPQSLTATPDVVCTTKNFLLSVEVFTYVQSGRHVKFICCKR